MRGNLMAVMVGVVGCVGAVSADIGGYSIGYQYNYQQPAATEVNLVSCSFFSSVVGLPGDIGSARTYPRFLPRAGFDMIEVEPGIFQGGASFTNTRDLFDAYPLQTYTVAIFGGVEGSQSGNETPPEPLHMPTTIPQFDRRQFREYQDIDGLQDYTFQFNTFESAGDQEIVYLVIDAYPSTRRVFFGQTTADAGEYTVPAGSLRLNRRYYASLYFVSYADGRGGGFGGVDSSIAAWKSVRTEIRTAGNCPPDFSGDGFLDFFDYTEYVAAFEAGDPDADFNGDGFLDFFDYNDFVAGFEGGC